MADQVVDRARSLKDPDEVPLVKIELDAVKWRNASVSPHTYSQKVDVRGQREISGPNGGPLQVQAVIDVLLAPANLAKLDDAEAETLDATLRPLLMKLAAPAAASGAGVVEGEFSEIDPAQEGAGG